MTELSNERMAVTDALRLSPVHKDGEPVGYLFRLRYGPDRWSQQLMFSDVLPKEGDYKELQPLYTHPKEAEVTVTEDVIRPEIKSEQVILERLAAGDEIAYSQDGDDAFFTKGDRAFVGKVIISMRSKGYLKRIVLDDENYRGGAERDVISDAGRATLDLVAALSRKG